MWNGRPVYLSVAVEGTLPTRSAGERRLLVMLFAFLVFIVVGGAQVARHNLRSGRGDRKGAWRVAMVCLVSGTLSDLMLIRHVASPWEFQLLASALGQVGLVSALVWTSYITVEPFVRRYWPESLISWNRLQAGQLRDPLVMSHVLAGLTTWLLITVLGAPFWQPTAIQRPESLYTLNGTVPFLAFLLGTPARMLNGTMILLLLVVVLRLLFRRRLWIADAGACILFGLSGPIDQTTVSGFIITLAVVFAGIWCVFWLLRRFGYVALLAAWMGRCLIAPFVPGTWYSGNGLIISGIILAVGTWAFYVIVTDRHSATEAIA
jgi:hypothetical protein